MRGTDRIFCADKFAIPSHSVRYIVYKSLRSLHPYDLAAVRAGGIRAGAAARKLDSNYNISKKSGGTRGIARENKVGDGNSLHLYGALPGILRRGIRHDVGNGGRSVHIFGISLLYKLHFDVYLPDCSYRFALQTIERMANGSSAMHIKADIIRSPVNRASFG